MSEYLLMNLIIFPGGGRLYNFGIDYHVSVLLSSIFKVNKMKLIILFKFRELYSKLKTISLGNVTVNRLISSKKNMYFCNSILWFSM